MVRHIKRIPICGNYWLLRDGWTMGEYGSESWDYYPILRFIYNDNCAKDILNKGAVPGGRSALELYRDYII